ncbi:MAG TPA: vWA domain-containing protein [Chloroflexia bacterium]
MSKPNSSRRRSNPTDKTIPDGRNNTSVAPFAGGFVGLGLGILGNLLASWLEPAILQDAFLPWNLVAIIALIVIGVVLGVRAQGGKFTWFLNQNTYWSLLIFVGVALLVIILLSVITRRTPVLYFVIDTTAKMQPIFNDVRREVQLSTSLVPRTFKIGLRTYGGSADNIPNCQDTEQLLPLQTYDNFSARIDSVLARLQPRGNGSLTGAVLEAIYTDLANENNHIQMLVVTSGTDPLCDPTGGGILERRAKEVKDNLEVIIISIGEIDASRKQILNSYAEAFNGRHINVPTAASLHSIVQNAAYYGYGYYGDGTFPGEPDATLVP